MGIEQQLLEQAERRGEKRGEKRAMKRAMKRGSDKVKMMVIPNARLQGASIELIADIVTLPVEKVRAILDKMGIE